MDRLDRLQTTTRLTRPCIHIHARLTAATIAAPTRSTTPPRRRRLQSPLPLPLLRLLLLLLLPLLLRLSSTTAAAATAAFTSTRLLLLPLRRRLPGAATGGLIAVGRLLPVSAAAAVADGGARGVFPRLFPSVGSRSRSYGTARLFATTASSSTSSAASSSKMASSSSACQLPFRPDSYGGVIIDPTHAPSSELQEQEQQKQSPPPVFPTDPEAFGRALDAALGAWRAEGKRGVWLKARRYKGWGVGIHVRQSSRSEPPKTHTNHNTTAAVAPGLARAGGGGARLHFSPCRAGLRHDDALARRP